jgi:perosamine synthetase
LNYRLPDILCSLGISQLSRIQDFKDKKARIYNSYIEKLTEKEKITTPISKSFVNPNWHLFPIHVAAPDRSRIFTALRNAGIGVQVNYIPAYWHPVFSKLGFKKGMFPESDKFYSGEISLPMFPDLTEKEIDYVVKSLFKAL